MPPCCGAASLRLEVAAGRRHSPSACRLLADKVVAQHLFTVDRKFYPFVRGGGGGLSADRAAVFAPASSPGSPPAQRQTG